MMPGTDLEPTRNRGRATRPTRFSDLRRARRRIHALNVAYFSNERARYHASERAGPRKDFVRELVAADAASARFGRTIATRFPPEPNGFLHIGHAKSICLNFGIANEYGGRCNLRFDDTNPFTEDIKYVNAIKEDVRWLGFAWAEERYASDYFEKLYEFAELLVTKGSAYVDSESEEAIRTGRGTVTSAGKDSPFRNRSAEENLDLLRRMRAGEFADGVHVLRAKIDMTHPNMIMRDPLLIRIRKASHYRRGDAWCIYPLYDYAHGLSDAMEDHPFALYARVQGQQRHLPVARARGGLRYTARADRVRASRTRLYHRQQA